MRFDRSTYKQKNRMLGMAVIPVALIAWVFSFSKTYTQIKEYRQLSHIQYQDPGVSSDRGLLDRKEDKLDSLIQRFTVDSVLFEDGFLQNVGFALQGLPVKVSYEGGKPAGTDNNAVIHKQLTLQGKYKDIVTALHRLERVYYLDRCRMLEGGRCVVSVAAVVERP